MKLFFGVIASVVLFYLMIKYDASKKHKKTEVVFSSRQPMSDEAFYQRFYKNTNIPIQVIHGVRKVLEEQLEVDMSRLYSTDDFSKNLAFFFEFDSMADVEIICGLEEEFSIKIADSEAEKTQTIDDIIQLVNSKLVS